MPQQIEDYIHRIGRTGRAGNQGDSLSFVDARNDSKIIGELIDVMEEADQKIESELYELANIATTQ